MKNRFGNWWMPKELNLLRYLIGFLKHPETLYNEFASVAEHVAALKAEGFTVTEGICGMPTAVMGEAGTEGPGDCHSW
jgi:metal-dependent amidase/aminoacylase/carboxypeptidase family protein